MNGHLNERRNTMKKMKISVVGFILILACLILQGEDVENEKIEPADKGDAVLLKVGLHLFEIGQGRSCVIAIKDDKTSIMIFDDEGNEDGMMYSRERTIISFSRVVEGKLIHIIDRDGDGLPDMRVVLDDEGNAVRRENLLITSEAIQ